MKNWFPDYVLFVYFPDSSTKSVFRNSGLMEKMEQVKSCRDSVELVGLAESALVLFEVSAGWGLAESALVLFEASTGAS